MSKYDFTTADTVYEEIDKAEQIVLSKYESTGAGHESVAPELPPEKVSILQLYRYADCTDIMFMCLGTIAAVCHGFAVQVNFFLMGETLDLFIETLGRNKSCDYLEHVTCDPDQDNQDLLELIPGLTLGFFCVSCATLVLGYLHMMSWNTTAERQTRVIRFKAFHNILVQHMGYFDKHMGGELNTRMTEDMATYQAGIGDKVACGMQWQSTFICGTILSFIASWKLTLVIMFVTPIAIGVGGTIAMVQRKFAGYESEAYAKAGGMAEEVLAGIRTVAVYGGEPKENERYEKALIDSRKYGIQKGVVSGIGQGVVWFIVFTVLGISFWYGGILVRAEEISPGKVLQVQFCMLMGLRNLGWSVPCLEALSISRGAAASIFKLIDNVSEIDSSSTEGKKLPSVQGNVTFENIWFAYPTRTDVPVLTGLNVEIPRGKTVALVGPSGCGKSTTIQLLQRQYNCQTGSVKLDGVDVTDFNIKWLRDQIGVVSQEPILFAATIMENLQFGRDDATKDEIIDATKEANAYDFIIKLPKGFDTMLSETGTLLSKGQKQRLCLARALIRKPAVLILDEATSALDNESESIVQAALDKASKGRTSIVIAHRLSTVRNADMLHVIKGGVVAESGTHDELMDKHGIYYGLVIQQLQAGKDQEDKEKARKKEQGMTDDYEVIAAETSKAANEREVERTKSVVSATSSAEVQEYVDDDEDFIDVPPPAMSRLFKMNAPEAHWLVIGALTAFIQGGTVPALAILFGEVLGAFGIEDHEEQKAEINFYCEIIVFTGVLAGIFTFCMIFFFTLTGERLTYRLRCLAFRSMLEKEIGWFDEKTNQVGTLTSRLANDASRVKGATGAPLCAIVNATSTAFLSLMIGFIFGWQLAIAIACLLPFLALTSYAQTRLMTSFARVAQISIEEGGKIISESVDKIKTVAALTKEPFFENKFQNYYNDLYKQGLRRAHIYGATWGISQFLIYLCFTVAFGLGGYLVAINVMGFNNVFRVFIAISAGGVELGRVNAFSADYSRAKVAAAKLFQLFETVSKINPFNTEGKTPEQVRGDVSFNDIRFCYPTRLETEVLRGFNASVKHGQFIALVGASGSGKSAAVQLLERFYDPQYGTVELDGIDVSEWNIQVLRKQMAMVSQEPILFCTSVKDNIAYGDNYRDVSMEEIIEAAKSANIHNFVQSLPLGYDTSVGSKGGQLSGGQKQRVAIARALIRNPKIIILDDATSALDSTSEKVVQDALDKAQIGRTSIVIAHRLSTIVSADIICYCDRGRIMEKGTHAELMAQKGYYYNLQQKYLGLRDQ